MKTDRLWLKLYISVTFALDTAYQIVTIIPMYNIFVKDFSNPIAILHLQRYAFLSYYQNAASVMCTSQHPRFFRYFFCIYWCYGPTPLCFTCMATWVRPYFLKSEILKPCGKVSKGNYLLTGFLFIAVLAQFIVTVVCFAQIYTLQSVTQQSTVVNTNRAFNITAAITDTLIAAVLIHLLLKHRSEFKKTNSVINRLIMYTIGTGLVTALWAIVGFISTVVSGSLFYLFVEFVIAKCKFFSKTLIRNTNQLYISIC